VYQAIEDGVAQGWVRKPIVPVFNRDLSGDQGGTSAIAIIQDLEKISCLRRRKWISEPIIEDEQLHTSEFGQKLWVGAVGMRKQ